VVFVLRVDGTGFVQVTLGLGEYFDEESLKPGESLPVESALMVEGKVRREERAPGGYELEGRKVTLVSTSEEYPIQKKDHSVEFLMENRHLWLRSRRQNAILRIRNQVMMSIHEFLQSREIGRAHV